MADRLELDEKPNAPEAPALELDAPAATSPSALLAKAGTLTGALVQRGRERSPRLMETSMPMELPSPAAPAAALEPMPMPAAPEATAERSRWNDVIFAAACCVAFFATFLFVLRF